MNVKNSNFNFYIYTLFLDHFCVLIVMIPCSLCSIHGIEKLLNNVFGHNVEQPLSWLDVNQTLRWPVKTFVYTVTLRDQLTFIGG